jgi:HlyD family secretion protein
MNKKKIIYATVVGLIAVAGIMYFLFRSSGSNYVFDTVKVARGNISNTVTATGTLEATETIDVGCQVSGVIETLYVDYNSIVKKGQLIAELDKSTLLSTLKTAEADLEEAEANYEYQGKNLNRMKKLFESNVLAESDYDAAIYTYKLSKASVKSAQASVEKANRNLGYASIYSPIDGIVKDLEVEEGNTVTASYSTPELFIITNDLSEMQVEADIDEADIGQIKLDQRVDFTVDAFPDDTFTGEVSEIRLEPTEESNVITYTVIILVKNPEKKLKPGMTASITAYVQEAKDVLLASGKGLRFTPDREMMTEYMSALPDDQKMGPPQGKNDKGAGMQSSASGEKQGPPSGMTEEDDTHKTLWIKEGEIIKPVQVEIGINDGSQIQILSGLEEGQEVVVSMEKGVAEKTAEVEDADETNPFAPSRPGGGPGKK